MPREWQRPALSVDLASWLDAKPNERAAPVTQRPTDEEEIITCYQ